MSAWRKQTALGQTVKKMQELAIRINRIKLAQSMQRTVTVLRAYQPPADAKKETP